MIHIGNTDFTDEKYLLDIRDKEQVIKARVVIPDNAIHHKELMKENYIQFSFEYDSLFLFNRGDYVDVEGTIFKLRENYKPEEVNTQSFKYTLKFEAEEMLLQDAQMYYLRQDLKEINWSLTANAGYFLQIVADNANRYFGTNDWKIGTVEPEEMKFINFNSASVLGALTTIAEQFEAEWYITGRTIHLVKKFSYGSEIEFENEVSISSMSHSQGNADRPYTRIVALGSTRNIPANYRKTDNGESVDAIYQKRLRIPVDKGDVIDAYSDISPEEVVEGSVIFEDVYPKRIGTMSDITTKEYADKDETTGEFTKWNAYRYKDSSLNFREKYILEGQELRIVFQSGILNGMNFAVKYNPDGFPETDERSQVFEIVRSEDYGTKLPNDTLKPENGDQYILYNFDIQMVENTYIPVAEQELYDKAIKWIHENLRDKSVYECRTALNYFAANEMDLELGQRIKLINNSFSTGFRSSRIMAFEKKLINKYSATYTVGDNASYSRLANIEKQIDELKYAGQVYQNTGGGNVYLIKQFDTTTPSDFNVYSAKASDAKYLNKQTGGSVAGDTIFQKNMQVLGSAVSDVFQNSTFTAGQLGSGFQIKRDTNGQSYMEIDNLMVRREAVFNKLTIAEIKSVGGTILLSLANMVISKVEDKGSVWRCYFDNADGTIPNDFAVDDQVICRKFTGKNIKYYWSRITSVDVDFIEISKTDKDGSGVPDIGDEVIQLGNRTDVNRQNVIMLSAYGSDAPSIKQYAGINSYDLTGKEVTSISPKGNKFTGSFTISTNGTTSPIYKDLGTFVNGKTYYLNDRVSHLGSYWVCIANSTIQTPNENSTAWRKDTTGTTDINNAINNIQIGGVNLFSNSEDFSINGGITLYNKCKRGDIFTLSIESSENISPGTADAMFMQINSQNWFIPISSQKQTVTIQINSDANDIILCATRTWTGLTKIKKLKFEYGNKATTWSPAPEDIEVGIDNAQIAANDAKTAADKAQTDANTANSLLSDMANDNKLVASEKQEVKREWDVIISEYSKNIIQANTFGVSTAAYTNAYNSLNNYITPLLSNLNVTTNIAGTTFRNIFKVYYDARLDLLNTIAKKAKDLADAAQNTANRAQSGVTEVKASLVILNDKIESKVSQSDFNSLQGRVSTSESKIEQQAGQITSMVEKVDKKNAVYTSYTDDPNDRPQIPYAKNDIWIKKDGRIFQSQNTRLSGMFIESDWKETVPSANDIQVGGVNLFSNSEDFSINGGITLYNKCKKGDIFTLSIESSENISPGTADAMFMQISSQNWFIPISSQKQTVTIQINSDASDIILCATRAWTGLTKIKKLKFEYGNKATTWSPAPEDIQIGIDNAQLTADSKNRTFYAEKKQDIQVPSGGFKVGDIWYKINTVDGCYETYRWNGSDFVIINVNVSKSRIEQTDEKITSIVEDTDINNFGIGRELKSMINQTADKITVEVNKIQIGGVNLLLNSTFSNGSISPWQYSGNHTISIDSANKYNGYNTLKCVSTGNGDPDGTTNRFFMLRSLVNGNHIFSFYAKTDSPRTFKIRIAGIIQSFSLTTEWKRYVCDTLPADSNIVCWLISSGTIWFALPQMESANKVSDWSPATEDIPEIVGSNLTLTENKISLASTTIELDGTTIAKSIKTSDLVVENDLKTSALKVLTDGTFYAKGSSGVGSLEIDSQNRFIELKSEINKYTENGDSTPVQQTTRIDAQTGEFRSSNADYDTAYLSSQGVFSNRAGIDTIPASTGASMKAAIAGLGIGSMDKDMWGSSWGIVGVYGTARNDSSNPAPAYGGYFDTLRANGLYLSVRQINSTTTLNKYDCYVSCYNKAAIVVYLPLSPYTGQVIYLRQMNSSGFTIHSNSGNTAKIHTDGNIVISTDNRAGRGDTTMLVYDGQYWNLNYMPR